MRAGVASVLALAGLAVTADAQDERGLVMGVRDDAPPFSYPVGDGHRGFMVDLCLDAFEGLYDVTMRTVLASERFSKLSAPVEEGGVDVLCDPTSINSERAADHLLSPQVFATGVGYLRYGPLPPRPEDGGATIVKVGYLRGTTADQAFAFADEQGQFDLREGAEVTPVVFDAHDAGLEAVCGGEISFYLGDLDILRGLREAAEGPPPEGRGLDCGKVTDSGRQTFTYEAYALAVDPRRPDVALALQSGIWEAFSNGCAQAYYDYYFARERSLPLQAVFSLNRVHRTMPRPRCRRDPAFRN